MPTDPTKMTFTLHVRVTPELMRAIAVAAKAERRNESELCRLFIVDGLERRKASKRGVR